MRQLGVLCVISWIGIAAINVLAYRSDTEIRQRLRILVYLTKSQWSPNSALIVGDSRVEALQCDSILSNWNVLNLGISGLTATQLKAKLGRWLVGVGQFNWAVVWIGVNDILNHGRQPNEVANDVLWIAEALAERASRVAIIGQIPMVGVESRDTAYSVNKRLIWLQEALSDHIAAKLGSQYESLIILPIDTKSIRVDLYSDAIHLNARGNGLVCELLKSRLAENAY